MVDYFTWTEALREPGSEPVAASVVITAAPESAAAVHRVRPQLSLDQRNTRD